MGIPGVSEPSRRLGHRDSGERLQWKCGVCSEGERLSWVFTCDVTSRAPTWVECRDDVAHFPLQEPVHQQRPRRPCNPIILLFLLIVLFLFLLIGLPSKYW